MNLTKQRTDSIIDAVLSASRVLVAVAARSLSDIGDDVTLTQYRSLVVLASRGPQNMAALADALGVTPATATRMCDRLVRKKLIVRRSERGDRRQVRLELSKTGLELVAVVTARRRLEIERIVGTVPEEERDILIHALKLFASAAGEVPEQDWSTGWDL